MSAQTKNSSQYLTTIDSLFSRYLAAYPEEEERLTVLAGQIRQGDQTLNDRKNMIGHLTGSALVINKENHCLLIYHRFLKRWLQPGGHLDPGEIPQQGALRELMEETGLTGVSGPIDFTPAGGGSGGDGPGADSSGGAGSGSKNGGQNSASSAALQCPIDIDSHIIPPSEAKQEGQHLHHDFQYIYKLAESGDIALDLGEVCDYKWTSLDEVLTGAYGERLRRVAAKMKASK